MYGHKWPTLGGWLIITLFAIGLSAYGLQFQSNLLWHGVAAQGVVTDVETVSCGRSGTGQVFSIQFTDRAGQAHTSTISRCDYANFNASLGDSVAIVYLPNDPTVIAPPGEPILNTRVFLILTILLILTELVLLGVWIRRRKLKTSLQGQQG